MNFILISILMVVMVFGMARTEGTGTGLQIDSLSFDQYGGARHIQGTATGWFHIEKINGRDFLVTPDGHGFISTGVVHIGAGDPLNRYSNAAYAEHTTATLYRYNFNTAGYGAVWKDQTGIGDHMPFFVSMELLKISGWLGDGIVYEDIFNPVVRTRIENDIAAHCTPVKDNPRLVGYYWTDVPQYRIDKRRSSGKSDWVSTIRALGADAPGKQAYIAFLKERYNNDPAAFSAVYNIAVSSFDELGDNPFTGIAPTSGPVYNDDVVFNARLAGEYYRIAYEKTREIDPNHLIFGDRYFRWTMPAEVIKEALPYIDALTIQPEKNLAFDTGFFHTQYLQFRKPLMLCDYPINFPTPEYPKTMAGEGVTDEAHAAKIYHDYLLAAFTRPYVLGVHRCQYISKDKGAYLKQGILKTDGTPYALTVSAYGKTHERVYKLVYGISPATGMREGHGDTGSFPGHEDLRYDISGRQRVSSSLPSPAITVRGDAKGNIQSEFIP